MYRFALTIEYHGGHFCGWQRTPDVPTIQDTLEEAIASVTQHPTPLVAAGRTDSGVHAKGQVVHADLEKDWEPFRLQQACNYYLRKKALKVLEVQAVSDDFNARFSATQRMYRYRILNRRAPAVMDADFVWHIPAPLDIDAMQAAALPCLGTHDFTSFRASDCQAKSAIKTLDKLTVTAVGEEVWVDVAARSFLYNQVRIFTGSLALVGLGKAPVTLLADALITRNRASAGVTAPAHGLTFMGVRYA